MAFLLSILNHEGIMQSPPDIGLSLLLHGGRLFCEDKGSACNGGLPAVVFTFTGTARLLSSQSK